MDLLNVVIRADTSGSDRAEASLEAVTAAARGADAAVSSLGKSSSSAVSGLNAAASASDRATASAKMYAAALGTQAQAARSAGVANDNLKHSTAGIAAQFQDIGVTAAMGMNPLMIALQQGTQLTGQLAVMDKPIQTLGKAFLSLVSPLSLITLGLVALSVVGLQMVNWGKTAEVVLDAIANVLVPIAPYAVAAAAGLALLYAPAIIGGIGALIASLAGLAAQALTTAAALVLANPVGLLIAGFALVATAAVVFRDDLAKLFGRDIVADAQQGINWLIGAFVGGFQAISMVWAYLPSIIADLTVQAANGALDGIAKMLNESRGQIIQFLAWAQGAFAVIPGMGTTAGALLAVMQGGKPFEAPVIPNGNSGVAGTVGGAAASAVSDAMDIDYLGKGIEFVQHAASGAADALHGFADAAGKSGTENKKAAKEAEKLADAYAKIVGGAREFIDKQENERKSLGMSTQEANALRYSYELLNKAREAGITLTPAKLSELTNLGRDMAAAEAETDRLTKAFKDQQKTVDDVLGTIGDGFSGLFDGTIRDFDGFIDHLVDGFAKLGQGNLDKLFSTDGLKGAFGSGQAANDNGGGSTNIFDAIFQGSKDGTKQGSASGIFAGLKGAQGISSMAGAGLGGFGIGAQTQNPVMGALGGALSGFAAGGPLGALVGGLGGLIGGLFGASKAAKEARQKLDQVRPSIEQFIKSMNGEQVSQYAKAMADAQRQAKEYMDLAKKAKDMNLMKDIQSALDQLPETLANEYKKDIASSINALRGDGYLNDVTAAQERYNGRLTDAAKLGVSADGALTEFNLTIQKIARDGDLTADQLARLAQMFPDLSLAIATVAAVDLSQLQANVERARSNLQAAYEKEAAAIRQVSDGLKASIRSLQEFKSNLKFDSALSPLDPQQRLMSAQADYEKIAKAALGGDPDAITKLEDVSRQYLEEARGYYASSSQYFAIFGEVNATLDRALAKAEQQVSAADRQLAVLDRQVSHLIGIEDAVMSVAEAVRALAAQQGALDAARNFGANPSRNHAIDTALRGQGINYQGNYGSGGFDAFRNTLSLAQQQIVADIVKQYAGYRLGGIVGAFANGGMVGNGLWDQDSVLARYAGGGSIALAGGEFVSNARSVNNRTLPVLDHINRTGAVPGNDNRELVAEIRALRAEVAGLKQVTAQAGVANVEATQENTAQVQRVSKELSVGGARR